MREGGGTGGSLFPQKNGKDQNQDNKNIEEKYWEKKEGEGGGGGGREKHEDVNRKMLYKEFEHCIHRTTRYGRFLLYEICDTNI